MHSGLPLGIIRKYIGMLYNELLTGCGGFIRFYDAFAMCIALNTKTNPIWGSFTIFNVCNESVKNRSCMEANCTNLCLTCVR